jgi:hypothetical protein
VIPDTGNMVVAYEAMLHIAQRASAQQFDVAGYKERTEIYYINHYQL